MCLETSQTSSHIFMQSASYLNYLISRIITCSVLPKIDATQQTLNPLERIVALSKFNRWPCKRYHFSWIQSLLCHLCWLSPLCYKSGSGNWWVLRPIDSYAWMCNVAGTRPEQWDPWTWFALWVFFFFFCHFSGNLQLSVSSGPVFLASLQQTKEN